MKLAASNIGWAPEQLNDMLPQLKEHGVEGLVIAPTMIWPEAPDVTIRQADELYERVEDAGLQITGMQSLTFGLKDAALSGEWEAQERLVEHLKRQAELAGRLGAASLVFGSPGFRGEGVEFDSAVDVFARVSETAADNGAKFCIEPLSGYNTKFITTTVEGLKLVEAVWNKAGSREGFGLHLDSAAIAGQKHSNHKLDIVAAHILGGITSFDASAPNLDPISNHPNIPHEAMADALRIAEYDGFVSLEVLGRQLPEDKDPIAAYLEEVDLTRDLYMWNNEA